MKETIPSLNGLRAISIFLVLSSHYQYRNLHWDPPHGGQIGVNIFFVISGFLITTLLLKEESKYGSISLKKFYIRRSLRILPVYYLLLFSYLILQIAGILNLNSISWISSITYTRYFFEGVNWEVEHLWSLNTEEHFYLIWPIIFIYFKRYRQLFSIIVIITVAIIRLRTGISILHFFTRADSIMFGCLFALNYTKLESIAKKPLSYLIVPTVLLILIDFVGKDIIPIHNMGLKICLSRMLFGEIGSITNICIGLVIIILITCQNNIFFKLLNSAAFNYLGILSYSIYIWQQLFFSNNIGWLSSFPLNIILILIVATISYEFYEKRFLKLKERFQMNYLGASPQAIKAGLLEDVKQYNIL